MAAVAAGQADPNAVGSTLPKAAPTPVAPSVRPVSAFTNSTDVLSPSLPGQTSAPSMVNTQQAGTQAPPPPIDPLAFSANRVDETQPTQFADTDQPAPPANTPPPPIAPPATGNQTTTPPPSAPTIAPLPVTQAPKYTGPAAQADMPNSPYAPASTAGVVMRDGINYNPDGSVYSGQSPNAAKPTISGLSEADKDLYWAGQGAINPDKLGLGTNFTPGQLASGTTQYQQQHQAAIDAITNKVKSGDAANLAAQNASVQQFDDNQNKAAYGAYATALNSQPGYAGSGMSYLDPNKVPDSWLGNGPALGQGGAAPATVANPVGGSYTPPDLGKVASQSTQTGPTDQGGILRPITPGSTGTDIGGGGGSTTNGPQTIVPPGGGSGGGGGSSGGTGSTPNTPSTDASAGLKPNQTTVDPNNDLRSQQITPGNLLDRFKLAQQQFGTFSSSTDPAYQLSLRQAQEKAAATGGLGSGMLRTSYGDLANQRGQQLNNERDSLFQNALSGSVGDAQTQFQDLMAEQAYQTGAQNQAFNQNVTGQQLQDQLTNSSFGRSLQQLNAGNSGNPSSALEYLSALYGQQGGQASQALGQMINNTTQNNANKNNPFDQYLQQLLKQMQGGGGGSSANPQPDQGDDGQ